VSTIIVLAQDTTIDKGFMKLVEYCPHVREALKTATRGGKSVDDLEESAGNTLVDLERIMHGVEQALRMPHAQYNEGDVERHEPQIRKILNILKAQNS